MPRTAHANVPIIEVRNLVLAGLALIVLASAVVGDRLWYLNFVHVMFGVMWTGIDLFMGFVAGPIIRKLELNERRAILVRLMPKMLFLMPTLSIVTSTAGWFLAVKRGYLDLPFPELWWVIAALAVVTILTIQGTGILLPINVSVLLQYRKAEPDFERIGRLMRIYVWVVASQGTMQVAIIVVMAKFVTGL